MKKIVAKSILVSMGIIFYFGLFWWVPYDFNSRLIEQGNWLEVVYYIHVVIFCWICVVAMIIWCFTAIYEKD